ncbi:probable G-protein coupled receptor 139 [Mobula birostris]|uniref:probable G-protein coupled receptor 139 n=1 Tax=Mobula birostris TaxID=1983395 RepID=UPI003B2818A4
MFRSGDCGGYGKTYSLRLLSNTSNTLAKLPSWRSPTRQNCFFNSGPQLDPTSEAWSEAHHVPGDPLPATVPESLETRSIPSSTSPEQTITQNRQPGPLGLSVGSGARFSRQPGPPGLSVGFGARPDRQPRPSAAGGGSGASPVTRPKRSARRRNPPIDPRRTPNLVAIVILSRGKCGLSKCVTRYLVGMAAADLLVVISHPLLSWTALIYFPRSFLFITPVCRVILWLISASTVTSVWLTVAFTVDRFVAICCEKLKTRYCTERTAAVVIGTVSVLACLEGVPWSFAFGPREIINGVPWDCVYTPSFTNSPSWAAFDMFHLILTPCLPFFLILLLNILTVRRILAASRARRGLRGQKSGENDKDRETENRRKSIVLLFSITGSFILLWGTRVIFSVYKRISMAFFGSVTDPRYITGHTADMLQVLSPCTNTCIYAVTQSKFREEMKNAVKYPMHRIFKFIKRGN